MKIGLFSVIEWSFLDQRPQVMAKNIADWGHQVIYFEPFCRLKYWHANEVHPWGEYESLCWNIRDVHPGVGATTMLALPAHNLISELLKYNQIYKKRNIDFIKSLNLDLAVVVDPFWGPILDEIGVPYIYDHVDDTHQMDPVITDDWYHAQKYCDKNAIATLYIQPNIARRYGGIYVSNGVDSSQLDVPSPAGVDFDCGCLSAIADWFDLESVLNSKKKLLIIGPMDQDVEEKYNLYRADGGKNVTWVPRVPRRIGAHWLKRCKSAMVPFNDLHPIVDYVMPLKLVEYIYLGLPSISYLNKGIEEEFGDFVTFYSSIGWRDLPCLDDAIEIATASPIPKDVMREFALKFSWKNVLLPLQELIGLVDQRRLVYGVVPAIAEYKDGYKIELLAEK